MLRIKGMTQEFELWIKSMTIKPSPRRREIALSYWKRTSANLHSDTIWCYRVAPLEIDNWEFGPICDASLSRKSTEKWQMGNHPSHDAMTAQEDNYRSEGVVFWDEKGRCKIANICMSYGTHLIRSIQFLFVNDSGHFVLSENHGADHGFNFITVVLDYQSEFITGIRGTYYTNALRSITFDTNKGSHGPYGQNAKSEGNGVFNLPIANDCSFAWFYGTNTNTNTIIEGIGIDATPKIALEVSLKSQVIPIEEVSEKDAIEYLMEGLKNLIISEEEAESNMILEDCIETLTI
ncbi:hypothetical protein BC332_10702 [Capsicum chinense]|nr:hypothetical protein BC332_10702 [Capsicum chinense]